MHVCWGRLSFGVSVRACSQELNPTKSARIGDSVGNRADIHCSTASSSEVFQGLYGTNACPECFDSFWPSSVSTAGRGGERGMTAHTVEPETSHCAQARQGWRSCSGAWWVTGNRAASPTLAHPYSPPNTPLAVLSPQLPPPKVMDQPQPAMLS